jgi:hypothetical protein
VKAYPTESDDYRDVIDWFKTLPLLLDLGGIRIVHACWDQNAIDRVSGLLGGNRLNDELIEAASRGGKLVAYRWDGEQKLSNKKFVWVATELATPTN